MTLSDNEIREIQEKYSYLINYDAEDPECPIDPLSYVDSNGDTLLHIAAQQNDLRTIELLLKGGVNVNAIGDMGCTALHFAKSKEVIDLLVTHGASNQVRNEFGKLPGEC